MSKPQLAAFVGALGGASVVLLVLATTHAVAAPLPALKIAPEQIPSIHPHVTLPPPTFVNSSVTVTCPASAPDTSTWENGWLQGWWGGNLASIAAYRSSDNTVTCYYGITTSQVANGLTITSYLTQKLPPLASGCTVSGASVTCNVPKMVSP